MKLTFTSLFLSFICISFGQKIEKFYNYKWQECEPNVSRFYSLVNKTDSGFVRKDYFIREKSLQMIGKYKDVECKIKEGYFWYYHPKGIVESSGKYINNKKDGLWIGYYANGRKKDSAVYSNGHKIGSYLSWHSNGRINDSFVYKDIGDTLVSWFDNGNLSFTGHVSKRNEQEGSWKYYHKNGQVSSIENYTNGMLTDKFYFDENGKVIYDTTNRDRIASFPKGKKGWDKYLDKKLYFPDGAKFINGDEAIVVVSFSINEEGKVEEVIVTTPFHPKFDKIAKEAVENSPNWIPAISHNRNIKFWIKQSVTFVQIEY